MTHRRLRFAIAQALVLGTIAAIVVAMPAGAASTATGARHGTAARGLDLFPTEIALPDGWLPEGIAINVLPFAFFGSRADGDLYRVNLVTGEGSVFSQGPGPGSPSVGLKLDLRARLFVAGGGGGRPGGQCDHGRDASPATRSRRDRRRSSTTSS